MEPPRLPKELHLLIFLHFVCGADDARRARFILGSVCKSWRVVVRGNVVLYDRVSYVDSMCRSTLDRTELARQLTSAHIVDAVKLSITLSPDGLYHRTEAPEDPTVEGRCDTCPLQMHLDFLRMADNVTVLHLALTVSNSYVSSRIEPWLRSGQTLAVLKEFVLHAAHSLSPLPAELYCPRLALLDVEGASATFVLGLDTPALLDMTLKLARGGDVRDALKLLSRNDGLRHVHLAWAGDSAALNAHEWSLGLSTALESAWLDFDRQRVPVDAFVGEFLAKPTPTQLFCALSDDAQASARDTFSCATDVEVSDEAIVLTVYSGANRFTCTLRAFNIDVPPYLLLASSLRHLTISTAAASRLCDYMCSERILSLQSLVLVSPCHPCGSIGRVARRANDRAVISRPTVYLRLCAKGCQHCHRGARSAHLVDAVLCLSSVGLLASVKGMAAFSPVISCLESMRALEHGRPAGWALPLATIERSWPVCLLPVLVKFFQAWTEDNDGDPEDYSAPTSASSKADTSYALRVCDAMTDYLPRLKDPEVILGVVSAITAAACLSLRSTTHAVYPTACAACVYLDRSVDTVAETVARLDHLQLEGEWSFQRDLGELADALLAHDGKRVELPAAFGQLLASYRDRDLQERPTESGWEDDGYCSSPALAWEGVL